MQQHDFTRRYGLTHKVWVVAVVLCLGINLWGLSRSQELPAEASPEAIESEEVAEANQTAEGEHSQDELMPDGYKLYEAYCTQCHGVKGDGKGINASGMEVQPKDHTDYDSMHSLTNEHMFTVIKHGGKAVSKSALMPNWDSNMSDQEIYAVINYLRDLCCEGDGKYESFPVADQITQTDEEPEALETEVDQEHMANNTHVAHTQAPEQTKRAAHASSDGQFHKFEMSIEEVELEVAPGFKAKVWAFNGQVPGPLIHVREGDRLEVTVHNNTTLNHTVHWHGVYQTNSWRSDGVPNVTQLPIAPGESYVYDFIADKPGSLWYHCHVNVPEHVGLRGMWGPLIVDPKEPTVHEREVTKEAILMFSGWNSEVADTYGKGGHPQELPNYVSINGKSFPITQPLRVKEGDVLRLRLYSVSTETHYHMHGHDMLVTHIDGLPIEHPYWADVIDVPIGGRVDALMYLDNPGLWINHDHIEQHTSNNGQMPGGAVMILEYDSVKRDSWYMWKDKRYDPDFYMNESLQAPYGIHNIEAFKGQYPERKSRGDE